MEHGAVWLHGEIDFATATTFCKRLHILHAEHIAATRAKAKRAAKSRTAHRVVPCYISSPGGDSLATLAIIDFIRTLTVPVIGIGVGQVASAAVWILAAFPKGSRLALENTRFFLHESWTQTAGKLSDSKAQHRENDRIWRLFADMLSQFTGKPLEKLKPFLDKDSYFGAAEAKRIGLIDHVVSTA